MASLGVLIFLRVKLLVRFLIKERIDFLGMQSLRYGYCFCKITLVDQSSRDSIPEEFLRKMKPVRIYYSTAAGLTALYGMPSLLGGIVSFFTNVIFSQSRRDAVLKNHVVIFRA